MYLEHESVTATGVLFLLRRHLLKTTLNDNYLVSVERYLRKNLIDTSERSVVLWTNRDHGMKILHSVLMSRKVRRMSRGTLPTITKVLEFKNI